MQEAIYWAAWRGFWKLHSIKVDNEYTTAVIKPGEDAKNREVTDKGSILP
jgi:hypothetical protein